MAKLDRRSAKLGRRSRGVPGGRPPGEILRAMAKLDRRSAKLGRRRVATGANHPASHSSAFRRGPGPPAGAPTGDQSTAMHVTPKPPLVRQDRDYEIPLGTGDLTVSPWFLGRFLAFDYCQ